MKLLPNILFVLILLSMSIVSTELLIALEKQALDGNVYTAVLDGEDDTLTFRDGSFQSSLYAGRGYDKGEYTTVRKGDSIWFEARSVSLDEGQLHWKGIIEGNVINGSYLDTQKGWFIFGDTTKKRNFTGNLKIDN